MRISDWSSDVCSSDLQLQLSAVSGASASTVNVTAPQWQLPSKAIGNPSCVSERRADPARGEIGIGRERDRAADDEDRGHRADRRAPGSNALLNAGRRGCGVDPETASSLGTEQRGHYR